MPHDKSGRLIEVGDVIRGKDYGGAPQVGVVTQVMIGSSTCNLTVAVAVEAVQIQTKTFTAGEVELVAKADGREL